MKFLLIQAQSNPKDARFFLKGCFYDTNQCVRATVMFFQKGARENSGIWSCIVQRSYTLKLRFLEILLVAMGRYAQRIINQQASNKEPCISFGVSVA